MKLRYYDPEPSYGGDAYYAGNISEWWWQHKNVNGNYDADNNTYIYHYDDLSRLNDSRLTYNESEDIADEFAERGITYDKNSNILTLNRSSLSPGDARNYRFSYDGNQRNRELESNLAYGYDANGNMGYDPVGDLFISYNLLNLPSMIRCEYDRRMYYRYLADGTKLSLGLSSSTATQRYIGSLVYDNGKFESASFGGGRLVGTNNGTDSEAHYFVTDHLGSTRVVAKVTSAGCEDLDRKDYYPFGKVWQQSGMPASGNRYTFSGKEQQRAGLASTKLLDFGARLYDPDGVTFLQQDPLMEKYSSIGQYNYCAGNPVKYVDRDGRDIRITYSTINNKGRTVTAYATYNQGKITYSQGATPTASSKEFVQRVQTDLNQLAADNPTLAGRIETLENSNNIHTIEQSRNNNGNTPESIENDQSGIPSGSTTAYNPDLESTPSAGERPARAGLAHELLGHGYDSDQGTTNYQKTSNGIPMYEVNAVNTENLVRKATDTPVRTTYDDKPIPQNLLQNPR